MPTVATTDAMWITGEEFARENRRLIDAGIPDESVEFQRLFARLSERDEQLFDQHGRSYLGTHPEQWIAISLNGEVIVRERLVDLLRESNRRFGAGNAAIRKLSNEPGYASYH
jgi:hypothetical protein